mgnify:CR=1 FL=1
MRQEQSDIGHSNEITNVQMKSKYTRVEDFVLEKSIFNNIFEKDIRKVFIYKKAERLAKAIHLIAPAFTESMFLKNKIDAIAIGLIDAAILPSGAARMALSRELLSLSSVLSIARTGGLLSSMNVELIVNEAHILLQEVANYEEPRLFLDDVPTLSEIAKKALSQPSSKTFSSTQKHRNFSQFSTHRRATLDKGHIKDRRDAVLSVIKNKKSVSIKDISTLIRGVSEKTIQRELSALITDGIIQKFGERRWSTYSIA